MNKKMKAAILLGKQLEVKNKSKINVCTACNGSGYYDSDGSPKCSCCNGTGKVRFLDKET